MHQFLPVSIFRQPNAKAASKQKKFTLMQFAERQKKKSSTLVGTALFRGYIPLANVLSQQQKTSLANSKVSTNKKKKKIII